MRVYRGDGEGESASPRARERIYQRGELDKGGWGLKVGVGSWYSRLSFLVWGWLEFVVWGIADCTQYVVGG